MQYPPNASDGLEDDSTGVPWNRAPVRPYSQPDRAFCAHSVEAGETLSSIARERYGYAGPRTMEMILAANPGLHPDRIYIGQTLYLPAISGKCAPPEPPPEPAQPVRYKGRTTGANLHLIPISSTAKKP